MMNSFPKEYTIYEIQKWIKDIFEDTDIIIPELEGNHSSVELLTKIIALNKEAEKEAQEVIKSESYLTEFYMRKSDEMSNILGSLSLNDLHPESYENLKKVASVAVHMKLKEPTITNFLLGFADLETKKENLTEEEIINGFTLSNFSNKITDIMQKNEILQRDIVVLEEKVSKQQVITSSCNEKSKFFAAKGKEYKKNTKQIEKHLKNLGWNTSLSHSELVKRSEIIQNLEFEVKELATKLESYEDLPPNEVLTRFKIEEAETELLRLQTEFENLLKAY